MKFRYDKNTEELVVTSSTRIEYHQLEIWLCRHVKGYRYIPAFKMGVWDGKQNYFNNGRISMGLWKEALRGCKEINASFIVENKEDFPINRDVTLEKVQEFCKEFFKDHKIKDKDGNFIPFFPYDHQIESAYKVLKNRYCLAEVATSGGKSLIISIVFFYILSLNKKSKFLIIVPSISLVSQMYDDLIKNFHGENFLLEARSKKLDYTSINKLDYSINVEEIMSDSPRLYSGKKDVNIYIGTYQSLEKWDAKFFKQFTSVACDEAHLSKAATLVSILKRTFRSAEYRFGVSGTFPSDDTSEILTIQSVLGPKITEVTAHELKEKGIITPMDIKAVIMNHEDKEFNERMKIIRKGGNGKDAFELEKAYIHVSEKRLDFIKKIVEKCDGNTLILFHTIEYGQKIFNKLRSEIGNKDFYYIDGGISGKKREEIKLEMEKNDGKIRVLIASFGTLSTGVSIRNLHNLILADSFKSEQIVIQSIGRLLRLFDGKDKAKIFDLIDVFVSEGYNNILFRHYQERQKFYIKRRYPFKETKINL